MWNEGHDNANEEKDVVFADVPLEFPSPTRKLDLTTSTIIRVQKRTKGARTDGLFMNRIE